MKTRVLWLLLLLSVAFNLGVVGTVAYHRRGSHEEKQCATGPASSKAVLYKELQLTPEQARQMDRFRADLQKRVEGSRAEMPRLRKAFLELLASPQSDHEAISRKLAEMGRVQMQIQQAVVDHLLAEKGVLSPKQQSKFLEMLERRFQREDHQGTGAPLPLPGAAERHGEGKGR